jgi:hypothetical protein
VPQVRRALWVAVMSRLPLTTFNPVAAFPEKLRAIQQGDGIAALRYAAKITRHSPTSCLTGVDQRGVDTVRPE